ncbi:MAG: HAMP domain-containing histidine kinase, partial [Myxococcales bacterium]|nr:HAMP domain-containing histidine kinase [Myxococcales bacterium]
ALWDPDGWVQRQAGLALAERAAEPETVELLKGWLARPSADPYARGAVAVALRAQADTFRSSVVEGLDAETERWRQAPLALGAGVLGHAEAIEPLQAALRRGDIALDPGFLHDLARHPDAGAVREALEEADIPAALEDLGNVEGASGRLRTLIERILELTDLETAAPGAREEVDVAGLLEGLVGGRGTLRADAGGFPLARRHLEQAVGHLVDNAVRFAGGVEVSARLGAELVVEVADRGPGMDAALLGQLLQPFQQRDMSYTRRHGGLGLGLALVRHHVRLLDGELLAAPREGGGTVFTVRVPRPSPDRTAPDPAPARPRS